MRTLLLLSAFILTALLCCVPLVLFIAWLAGLALSDAWIVAGLWCFISGILMLAADVLLTELL